MATDVEVVFFMVDRDVVWPSRDHRGGHRLRHEDRVVAGHSRVNDTVDDERRGRWLMSGSRNWSSPWRIRPVRRQTKSCWCGVEVPVRRRSTDRVVVGARVRARTTSQYSTDGGTASQVKVGVGSACTRRPGDGGHDAIAERREIDHFRPGAGTGVVHCEPIDP